MNSLVDLLQSEGPWELSELPRYVETAELRVALDASVPQPGGRAVVLTVVGAGADDLADVVLVDARQRRHPGQLGRRGQLRFDTVPDGACTFDVHARRRAGGFLRRSFALAAASAPLTGREELANSDGSLSTIFEEGDDGHLVVTVIAHEDPNGRLGRFAWQLQRAGGDDPACELLTPFPAGAAPQVKYDLGPLGDADAVRLVEANWASLAELDEASIDRLAGVRLFGSAARAWRELYQSGVCSQFAAQLQQLLE
ncbi:MAG: hypothetical protein ACKVWR_07825 [Acidimicrobiales bacterium]